MNNIALLSDKQNIMDILKYKYKTIVIFDNYLKFLSTFAIRKFKIIIIDVDTLPVFNEQEIISLINEISSESTIILISKNNDSNFIKSIRNKNNIAIILQFPIEIDILEKIINYNLKGG